MDEVSSCKAGESGHASEHQTLHLQADHKHRGGERSSLVFKRNKIKVKTVTFNPRPAGFPSVRQALARPAPAARRLWEQRRSRDPLHGGGCGGDGPVLDRCGHAEGG